MTKRDLPTEAEQCSVSFLPPDPEKLARHALDAWNRLDRTNNNLYSMYQSPDWWEHLANTSNSRCLAIGLMNGQSDQVLGLVPLEIKDYSFDFSLAKRIQKSVKLRTAFVLGGQPLIPATDWAHDMLFKAIWSNFKDVDAIYLKGIPSGSPCWSYINRVKWKLSQAIVHREAPVRSFYTVSLPNSFSEYLARFSKKKRYNLNRQVRLLREAGNGDLQLQCIKSEDQIPAFIHDAAMIAKHSWQHRHRPDLFNRADVVESLRDLARRNLLRAYLLICGGEPCAFVLGYQRNHIYHYADIGYDEHYARFSPGAVLYYLMMEDLIADKRPAVLNFGIGDSEYKRQFATDRYEEATILLLRPHLKNSLLHLARSTCLLLKSIAKSLLHRFAR